MPVLRRAGAFVMGAAVVGGLGYGAYEVFRSSTSVSPELIAIGTQPSNDNVEPAGSTFFYSFVLFLLLAPLYKAGNRALPLLLLELAAIGFLLVLALRRGRSRCSPPCRAR